MKIRPANTRGVVQPNHLPLLTSYRSFSCMSYKDPRYVRWGPIIAINDDRTKPGFVTVWHEHVNLDILNYMIKGKCRHIDDKGNDNTAESGQIQHFWCGTSMWHELRNDFNEDSRYLQIWIEPNTLADPAFTYELINKGTKFSQIPVRFKNDSIEIWAGICDEGFDTQSSYLLVLEGSCIVNGIQLDEGDAVEIYEPATVLAIGQPHLLLFELK